MLCRMPHSAEPRRRMRTHCPLLEISAPLRKPCGEGLAAGHHLLRGRRQHRDGSLSYTQRLCDETTAFLGKLASP